MIERPEEIRTYVDCVALLSELDLAADDLAGLEPAQQEALVSGAVKKIRVMNHPDLLKDLADRAQANQRSMRVSVVERLVLSHDFRLALTRKDDRDPVAFFRGFGDAQQEPVSSTQAAADWLEAMAQSRSGLIYRLERDGFTTTQAEYGVDAVGY